MAGSLAGVANGHEAQTKLSHLSDLKREHHLLGPQNNRDDAVDQMENSPSSLESCFNVHLPNPYTNPSIHYSQRLRLLKCSFR